MRQVKKKISALTFGFYFIFFDFYFKDRELLRNFNFKREYYKDTFPF